MDQPRRSAPIRKREGRPGQVVSETRRARCSQPSHQSRIGGGSMMKRRSVISTIALFLAWAATCAAQDSRATVIGRATDPSGAILTGAVVRAVNIATNTELTSNTNESGNYEIPYLLSGVYTVSVELPGFKKVVRSGIQLRVGDRVTLDFTMSVGDVAETVTVTAETPLLEASTADLGLVMEQRRV